MLLIRPFLRYLRATASICTLGTACLAAAAGPARESQLSLGYSLYGMKSMPVEEAVSQIIRIGYKNIELTVDAGFPAEPKLLSVEARRALRDQARASGVHYSALMLGIALGAPSPVQTKNLAAIKAAVQLAKDLAPEAPPPVEVILSGGKPTLWEEQKNQLVENLKAWVAAAAENGGTMVIGAHANMTVNTADKLLWLYERAARPELGLYYNHIHFDLEGMPLAESWKRLGPYVKFIHLQEATGTPAKRNYMLPGAGHTTDFVAYFRMLEQTGYHGPLVVEVSGAIWKLKGYDPIKTAQTCYSSMHAALEEAGVAHE
jgi:sugar phosphate isomerase/epimerase